MGSGWPMTRRVAKGSCFSRNYGCLLHRFACGRPAKPGGSDTSSARGARHDPRGAGHQQPAFCLGHPGQNQRRAAARLPAHRAGRPAGHGALLRPGARQPPGPQAQNFGPESGAVAAGAGPASGGYSARPAPARLRRAGGPAPDGRPGPAARADCGGAARQLSGAGAGALVAGRQHRRAQSGARPLVCAAGRRRPGFARPRHVCRPGVGPAGRHPRPGPPRGRRRRRLPLRGCRARNSAV